MKYARSLLRLLSLLVALAAILVAAVTARSAPLTDTEKAIIAVLLGNKSSFYSIGGTVTYLASGKTLTLQLNGGSNLSISSNGGFTFSEDVMGGDNYQVTVLSQPAGQTCTVNNGAGSVEDDIKNVSVTCDSGSTYAAIIRGRTIDGYIQGANVFLDINGNGTLDSDEPSGTSGEGGRFEIGLNEEQAACKALAPVVADVPVGAIDETEGEVTEAYQMALPPGTEAIESGAEVFITPLTSILWAELYDLYNTGQIPGLSCSELESNPDAQQALQEKITEAIANAVSAYNIPKQDLLGDYIASGSNQSQRTAADIVEGLKWSLREKLRLEQLYPDAQRITVVFMRVTGSKFGDANAAPDEYGWYVDYSIFEEKLIRRGIVRLEDDLSIEQYIVFYRERYPRTMGPTGVNFDYARSLRLTDDPNNPYQCWGQEFARVEIEYGGWSDATPMGLGVLQFQIENETVMPVESFEECGPEVHQQPIFIQALAVTDWSRYREDGIYKEGTQYRYQGDDIPLPHLRGFAGDPEILTPKELISTLSNLPWRFFEPLSGAMVLEDKDLETDGQRIFIRKSSSGSWQRIERFDDGTSLEQWINGPASEESANVPFDTPVQCIDWDNAGVDPDCNLLPYHLVTTRVNGEGTVSPAGPLTLPEGERFRATLMASPGWEIGGTESTCGGSPHGLTFLSPPLTNDCVITINFVSTDDGESAECTDEDWVQLGADVLGEQVPAGDGDGAWSTGMNAVGTIIAEGARYNDEQGSHSGQVRVFEWSGAEWAQLGQDIAGSTRETMGWDVALDAAGDSLAVGAPCERAGCVGGYVRVFDFNGTSWVQRGEDIVGVAAGDREGWAVDISDDGLRILTLAERGTTGESRRLGRVRVYDWIDESWQQAGDTVVGPKEYSYPRVARLSNDGSHLIVGYVGADLVYENSAQVAVRTLVNDQWVLVGQPIEGTADVEAVLQNGTHLGLGVALSSTLSTIAFGSDQGLHVFDLENDRWTKRGGTILGPDSNSAQLGWGIELRNSGNTVVASAIDGSMGVWVWTDSTWVQKGSWLGQGGTGARDIGASADGSKLVLAQQGFNARQGRLQAFEFSGCP